MKKFNNELMERQLYKYRIYGRSRGRKRTKFNDNNFFNDHKINTKKDLKKNKKNILDIGSGNGENSLFLADKNPNALIVAVDIFQDGNINLCNQISNLKLNNIKLYSSNVLELFDQLKKEDFFNEIWILFPDPWPKKRHYKRRLINENFFKKVCPFLKKNGKIFIATDSASYLRSIMISIYKTKFLFNWHNDRPQIWTYEILDLPFTKFFKKAKNSYRIPFFIELIKI